MSQQRKARSVRAPALRCFPQRCCCFHCFLPRSLGPFEVQTLSGAAKLQLQGFVDRFRRHALPQQLLQ